MTAGGRGVSGLPLLSARSDGCVDMVQCFPPRGHSCPKMAPIQVYQRFSWHKGLLILYSGDFQSFDGASLRPSRSLSLLAVNLAFDPGNFSSLLIVAFSRCLTR